MTRKPIEPDDWVAPFDFTFCGKCFNYLVDNGIHRSWYAPPNAPINKLCAYCTSKDKEAAIEKHNRLSMLRDQICKERQKAGFPPLYWMLDAEWVKKAREHYGLPPVKITQSQKFEDPEIVKELLKQI